MPPADPIVRGAHVMTVCNACRYCEQYCPVFPAMENRLTFPKTDLAYLANLCHNCGECLYACQYAPPHEFGINVPRVLAEIREVTYEEYCWPRPLAAAFRRHGVIASLALAAAMTLAILAAAWVFNREPLLRPGGAADFYSVVPHGVMVTLFGGVGLFVVVAIAVAVRRYRRDIGARAGMPARVATLRDVLTLRHLHATGDDCTSAEERRTPWRRWMHHFTFYGFLLCFASTSVAAAYHTFFGWIAPYGYTSLPVVLGTLGGVGLIVGPVGLLVLRRRRDPALGDPAQGGLDEGFIALLLLTSATGLALLALRHRPIMGLLLVVHLGAVLALFLTLPYGKFVHGFYRTVALLKFAREDRVT